MDKLPFPACNARTTFPCTWSSKFNPILEILNTFMTPVWCEQALLDREWEEGNQITTTRYNKHHMTLNIILLNQQRFMRLSGRRRTT